MSKKSLFLKEIERVIHSENDEVTDSEEEKEENLALEDMEAKKDEKTGALNPIDESNISLLVSPQKFHAYLLNSMNIRVDEDLSSHFFDQLRENESEEEEEKEDNYDKDSYNSDDQNYEEAEGEGENDTRNQDEQDIYQDDESSRRSDSKSKNRSNFDDQSSRMYKEDTNLYKKAQRKFEDPFKHLPKPVADMNYSSSYLQMSLASLIMNDQYQKL